MMIITRDESDRGRLFDKLKRRAIGDWKFVAAGSWSQSPYHEGTHRFYIRSDVTGVYWALLSKGFPNRIIAVAESNEALGLQEAAVAMLRAVRYAGGDFINDLNSTQHVDARSFWDAYRARDGGLTRAPMT